MSDPRFTDPYDRNSQLSDPVLRRDPSVDSAWGWIAGIAVVVLIAFIVIAGWSSSNNTASNGPAFPITSGTLVDGSVVIDESSPVEQILGRR